MNEKLRDPHDLDMQSSGMVPWKCCRLWGRPYLIQLAGLPYCGLELFSLALDSGVLICNTGILSSSVKRENLFKRSATGSGFFFFFLSMPLHHH